MVAIGAVVGTPGGEYLVALHEVVTGKAPTDVQVADVVVFVVIESALVIVPFVFLVARPEGIKAAVERFKAWLIKHAAGYGCNGRASTRAILRERGALSAVRPQSPSHRPAPAAVLEEGSR